MTILVANLMRLPHAFPKLRIAIEYLPGSATPVPNRLAAAS
jgi:hypothetical protein